MRALPASPEAVAAYLEHKAARGRSGRAADRGQETGWSAPTLVGAARAISRAHTELGYTDPTQHPLVTTTLDRLRRECPAGTEARTPIRAPEVARLREVPAPSPGHGVLVTRLALLLAGVLPDVDPGRLAYQVAAAGRDMSIKCDAEFVIVHLPAYSHAGWGASARDVEVRHEPQLGAVGCAHCVALMLDEAAEPGDGATGTGSVAQAANHVRERWRGAAARAGYARDLVVPDHVGDLVRLSIHLDIRLVAFVEQHAAQAYMRSTSMRVSEVIELDMSDLTRVPEGVATTIRRRKNDRRSRGHEVGISAAAAPRAIVVIALWLWLRGSGPGPVFPGHGARVEHRHKSTVEARLAKLAAAAGVSPDRLGPHGFRSGGICDALDAGASFFLLAKRVGITEQVMYDSYYSLPDPFVDNIAAQSGLEEDA